MHFLVLSCLHAAETAIPIPLLYLLILFSSSSFSPPQNCVGLGGVPADFLRRSRVNLLVLDANPLLPKEFQSLEGYAEYEQRFTASKKKGDVI